METTGETLADWWNGLLALDPQELLVNTGVSFLVLAVGSSSCGARGWRCGRRGAGWTTSGTSAPGGPRPCAGRG